MPTKAGSGPAPAALIGLGAAAAAVAELAEGDATVNALAATFRTARGLGGVLALALALALREEAWPPAVVAKLAAGIVVVRSTTGVMRKRPYKRLMPWPSWGLPVEEARSWAPAFWRDERYVGS